MFVLQNILHCYKTDMFLYGGIYIYINDTDKKSIMLA